MLLVELIIKNISTYLTSVWRRQTQVEEMDFHCRISWTDDFIQCFKHCHNLMNMVTGGTANYRWYLNVGSIWPFKNYLWVCSEHKVLHVLVCCLEGVGFNFLDVFLQRLSQSFVARFILYYFWKEKRNAATTNMNSCKSGAFFNEWTLLSNKNWC